MNTAPTTAALKFLNDRGLSAEDQERFLAGETVVLLGNTYTMRPGDAFERSTTDIGRAEA